MGSVLHSKNPAEGRSKRRENPAAGYRLTRSKRGITQSHAVTRATIRVFPAFRRLIRASGDLALLTRGLEPPRVAPYGPEPYASASSAT
jgi:hypothetical protein